jgi:hypothetical protein
LYRGEEYVIDMLAALAKSEMMPWVRQARPHINWLRQDNVVPS